MRNRTSIASTAVLASAALVLAGCAGSSAPPVDTSELTWGIVASNMASVEPLTFTAGNMLLATIYDALMTAGPDGQIAPGLAESVDDSDPMKYVFDLRDDVTFWNGDPLTAEDVVYSLDYERLPPSAYESLFINVDTVSAPDEDTVVITMKQPDAGLLSLLASPGASIFQKKFHEEHKENFGAPGTLVMATGPYEITSLDATRGAEFVANPDWYGGEPAIEKLSVKPFKTLANAALAYRTGEVDAVFQVSDPKSFESNSGETLTSVEGCKQTFLALNTQVAPFDDVHVRSAVERALNREELAESVGVGASTYKMFLPDLVLGKLASESQIQDLNATIPDAGFDLDAAADELAESAYPDGVASTLQVYDDGVRPTIAQAMAGTLAEAGIDITVEIVSEDEWNQAVGEGDPLKKSPMQLVRVDCSEEPNLTASWMLDGANAAVGYSNYAAYSNPEVDRLIDESLATNDPEARFAAYSEMMQIVAEDVPYVPVYLEDNVVALADGFAWPTMNAFSSVYGPAAWVAQVESE